jgi:calcineurin-like phosphoesterase family protein
MYRFYRERIDCREVILIWGNHDPKVDSSARELVRPIFSRTYDKVTVTVNRQRIHLNHEAVAIWDGRHHGVWHLYGHSHGGGEEWLEQVMPGRLSIDVGVDNAHKLLGEYRPFSFDDIHAIMKDKPGFGLLRSREYHHRK